MSTNQVTVASTSTLVVAANANRVSIVIENIGSNDLYLGQASDVTTATAGVVLSTKGVYGDGANPASKCWLGGIYGLAKDSTTTASYWEVEQ